MLYTGQQPGTGFYECEGCDAVFFLHDRICPLPICFKCHGSLFAETNLSIGELLDFIPCFDDAVIIRQYKQFDEEPDLLSYKDSSEYVN